MKVVLLKTVYVGESIYGMFEKIVIVPYLPPIGAIIKVGKSSFFVEEIEFHKGKGQAYDRIHLRSKDKSEWTPGFLGYDTLKSYLERIEKEHKDWERYLNIDWEYLNTDWEKARE